MARLVAVVLVAVVAIAAWLAWPLWRGNRSAEEVARIPASEALTRVVRETLCRAPRDEDTVRWDSRPFGTSELRTALESSPEGKRVGAIRQAYLKVLLRDPLPGDCDGVRQWVDRDLAVDDIERRLANAPEATRISDVRRVFREVLRRDPAGWDAASLRYWVESDLSLAEIRIRLSEQRPLVGVHYFTWYRVIQGRWGNGATFVDEDAPRPASGAYESDSIDVIDRHIAQIAAAGFDFVIVDVVADDPRSWATAQAFFSRLRGAALKAAVMLDGLYMSEPSVKAGFVEKARDAFTRHPNYFSYLGRPLVAMFATRMDFSVPGLLLRNVYWTNRYDPGVNTFNFDSILHPYDWPFWAPTPQPLVNGIVPVMPGYIDTHLGRENPMFHPRNDGQLYHEQWQQALAQKPEVILVYSWNEYFEQTAIEPTQVWGDSYVRWTRCYITHAHQGTTGRC
jgi:hypothetical protein